MGEIIFLPTDIPISYLPNVPKKLFYLDGKILGLDKNLGIGLATIFLAVFIVVFFLLKKGKNDY